MNPENFKSGDIEKLLKELGVESVSSDRIKNILKTFLIYSSENGDIAAEMVKAGSVEVLVELFNGPKGKPFKGQIACILLLLATGENPNDEKSVSEITIIALSSLFSKADFNVFLQCISGIRDIALLSNASPSSPLSSLSSPTPGPPVSCLTVSSSALLLEKGAEVLSSTAVRDRIKQDVLDTLLELVNTGVMNEATEFVGWRQTQMQMQIQSPKEKSECCFAENPAVKFAKAFEAFTESVKGLSKKRTVLGCAADKVYGFIQEKTFFPTFVSLPPKKSESEVNFPCRFMANSSAGNVANSGSRLYWNSSSGNWNTFFVDLEMNEGLYKIAVEISGKRDGGGEGVGLNVKEQQTVLATDHINYKRPGCSLRLHGGLYCGSSIINGSFCPSSGNLTIELELDTDKRVVYFFVNGSQISHCVTNVPRSTYFVVSGYHQTLSYEIKSLKKVASPSTSSNVSCTQHAWE